MTIIRHLQTNPIDSALKAGTQSEGIMTKTSKRFITIGLAALLAVILCAGPAYAYFTAVTSATGEKAITLGYSAETDEDFDGEDKAITMKNTGDTDVMVRVILLGVQPQEGVDISIGGSGWVKTEATEDYEVWNYVADALHPNETTPALKVDLTQKTDPDNSLTHINFDIQVVGQCSPAVYDDSGKAHSYTDWK